MIRAKASRAVFLLFVLFLEVGCGSGGKSNSSATSTDPVVNSSNSSQEEGGSSDSASDLPVTDTPANTVDQPPKNDSGTQSFAVTLNNELANISINPITPDDVVNAQERDAIVPVTGSTSGGIQPGDILRFELNSELKETQIESDGNFRIDIAGSELVSDTHFEAYVDWDDNGENYRTTAISTHKVDLTASAGIFINQITSGDVINAMESAQLVQVTGSVSGDAREGSTVRLRVNNNLYAGLVGRFGNFSIEVPGSDLTLDTTIDASVTGVDDAGNSFVAQTVSTHSVDTFTTASITLDSITNDDVINASEAAQTIMVTGLVGGDATSGDSVNLDVNNKPYNGVVTISQRFSIPVDGADLAASPGFTATVTGTDDSGNPFNAAVVSTHTVDVTATINITVFDVTGDGVINTTEAAQVIPVAGTVSGEAELGDVVTVLANGNSYTGQVDLNNNFSVDVPGADLSAQTTFNLNVSGADDAGNFFSVDVTPTVTLDFNATATIIVDNITADDIISQAEAAQIIPVTGSVGGDATTGDIVSFNLNGSDYQGLVDNFNGFSINVAGGDLLADLDFDVTVSGTDASGNAFSETANSVHTIDTNVTATLNVDNITADDIINNAESLISISVTGSVGGDVDVGDPITLTVNGNTYNGLVLVGNVFSVDVAGVDLAAQTTITANVTGNDLSGNPFDVDVLSSHTVDLTASATISVDNITADDVIVASEASGIVAVTGSVAGDATEGDAVRFTVNGNVYAGLVDEFNLFSIDVVGGDLELDTDFTLTVFGQDDAGNDFTADVDSTHSVNSQVPVISANQKISYVEHQNPNAALGSVSASDDISVTSFKFTNGTQTTADGYFAINDSGQIFLTAAGASPGLASNDFELGRSENYRYVRVQRINDTGQLSLSELRVIDVATGQNIAIGKSVVASSEESASYAAANAADGSISNSVWLSSPGETNPNLTIDLGASYNISQIDIITRQDIPGNESERTNIAILLSNTAGFESYLEFARKEDLAVNAFNTITFLDNGGTNQVSYDVIAIDSAGNESSPMPVELEVLDDGLSAIEGRGEYIVEGNILEARSYDPWNNSTLQTSNVTSYVSGEGLLRLEAETTDAYFGSTVQGYFSNMNVADWFEWHDFTMSTPGVYTLTARVATPNDNAELILSLSDINYSFGSLSVPNTGGWESWTDISMDIEIGSGQVATGGFELRVSAGIADLNVDYIDIQADDTTINAGGDRDWVEGGAGVDRIYLGDTASAYNSSLSFVNASTLASFLFIQDAIITDGNGLLDAVRNQVSPSADVANGGDGGDFIYGEEGTDAIFGGDGNDTLIGDGGRDAVRGGDGDDLIIGGTHADVLQGDSGQDTFLWEMGDENDDGDTFDNSKTDIITDFNINAISGDNLNLAELLEGESSSAVSLDNYLSFVKDNADTIIQIDVNGDGSGVDWQIRLASVDLAADFNSDQDIINSLLANNALVVDMGDSAPPEIDAGQVFNYVEGQIAGAVVGTVLASDDAGVTSIRFAEGSQTSSDGYFQVGNNGQLTLTAAGAASGVESNEFEVAQNNYVYSLLAFDAVGNQSSPTNIILNVTDDGAAADDGNGLYIVSGGNYDVTAYDAYNSSVVQYSNTTPYQTGTSIFREAEDYNAAGGGTWPDVTVDPAQPYMIQDFNSGEWIRWDNITLQYSGYYTIFIRAAKGDGFGDGVDLSLYLDNRNIELTAGGNVTFDNTGGWGDPEDGPDWITTENTYYINAITNTNFEIVTNIDAVNIDWIMIYPHDLYIDAGAGIDLVEGGSGSEIVMLGETDPVDGTVLDQMTAAQLATTQFIAATNIQNADGLFQSIIDEISGVGDIGNGAGGGDSIDGQGGTDFIVGGDGEDYLRGGDGRDAIRGGGERDRIIGGPGADVLKGGGAGDSNDTFIWELGDELGSDTFDTTKTDIVLDFDNTSGDVLDLSGILQGELRNAAFLDNYLDFRAEGSDTIVDIDVDGDGSGIDWHIRLVNEDLNVGVDSDETIIGNMITNQSLVVDVSDNSPPVITATQTFNAVENQTAGATIGTVSATDSVGVAGFRFGNGTQTSYDGYYQIDNTGVITITAAGAASGVPNNEFELGSNSFNYNIVAFDLEGNESTATQITLNVLNDGAADDDGIGYYIVSGNRYDITAYDPYDPAITQYTSSTEYRGARQLELYLPVGSHTSAGNQNGIDNNLISTVNGYYEYLGANEWVAYDNGISFSESTTYTLEIEVARESGSTAPLNFDLNQGTINLGGIQVPSTGGWGSFIVMQLSVFINAGNYGNFGVSTASGGANWRNISFYKDGGGLNISTGAGRDWVEGGSGDDIISLGTTSALYNDGAPVVLAETLATYDFATIGSITDANGLLQSVRDEVSGLADMAHGQDGQDQINGNRGTDAIYGGDGADTLNGGRARDIVRGGRGADLIIGGTDPDVLRGDAGADTFFWQNGDHLGTGSVDNSKTDIILDFERDIDSIHLGNLLQGESENATSLSNYLSFSYDGVSTTIHIDVDGNGSGTDWNIELRQINLNSDTQTATQIINNMLSRGELDTD